MHRQSASWKRFFCAAIINTARLKHAPWKAGLTKPFLCASHCRSTIVNESLRPKSGYLVASMGASIKKI